MARATKKKTTQSESVAMQTEFVEPVQKEEKVMPKPKKIQKHDQDDLILCTSCVQGELIYQARKSGNIYTWAAYGDSQTVEYQDLRPLVLTRDNFVTKPYMIVEDEMMWEEFPALKDMYMKMVGLDNIDNLLLGSNERFRDVLLKAPEGLKDSIKVAIATRIDEGTFDSIQKIKIADQILGTDLMCMINS